MPIRMVYDTYRNAELTRIGSLEDEQKKGRGGGKAPMAPPAGVSEEVWKKLGEIMHEKSGDRAAKEAKIEAYKATLDKDTVAALEKFQTEMKEKHGDKKKGEKRGGSGERKDKKTKGGKDEKRDRKDRKSTTAKAI